MKHTLKLAFTLVVALSVIINSQAADDITSILNKIETKKDVPKIPTKNIDSKKSNTSSSSSSSKTKASKPSQPQIPLWQPKDTLPKDIAGQGLYGNFVIRGEDINGGAEIIAAEDAANPFARVFTIEFRASREKVLADKFKLLRKEIIDELMIIVREVCEAKGLNVLYDTNGMSTQQIPVVLYTKGVFDITNACIEKAKSR